MPAVVEMASSGTTERRSRTFIASSSNSSRPSESSIRGVYTRRFIGDQSRLLVCMATNYYAGTSDFAREFDQLYKQVRFNEYCTLLVNLNGVGAGREILCARN